MNTETINVSLYKGLEQISYPIFVGSKLLNIVDDLLNKYIVNKKIIIIYDNFFSSKLLKSSRNPCPSIVQPGVSAFG